MNISDEIQLIGPAYKKIVGWTRQGTALIKLSDWYEDKGLVHKNEYGLIERDSSGLVANFNPSPVVCIVEKDVGHQDISLVITGEYATPSGWSEYDQFGQTIYTRIWDTGSTGVWYYDLSIPKYTRKESIFLVDDENAKTTIRIKGITRSEGYGIFTQPNDHLSFYALGDTNTKFLWGINWNKSFEYFREVIDGIIGTPPLCSRCGGYGWINGIVCKQCEGTKFAGFHASGLILRDHSRRAGILKQDDETIDHFLKRLWSYNWWVTPTEAGTKKFLSKFADVNPDNIRITQASGLRGQQPQFHVHFPTALGVGASFTSQDEHWKYLVESLAPAGVISIFSLFDDQFPSGFLNDIDDYNYYGDNSPTYYNYKGTGGSTGWETGVYSSAFWALYFNNVCLRDSAWNGNWCGNWLFFESGAESGYESGVGNGCTGYGYSPMFSGYWSFRGTGETTVGFIESGTCYYDNFYASGMGGYTF